MSLGMGMGAAGEGGGDIVVGVVRQSTSVQRAHVDDQPQPPWREVAVAKPAHFSGPGGRDPIRTQPVGSEGASGERRGVWASGAPGRWMRSAHRSPCGEGLYEPFSRLFFFLLITI